MTAAVVAANVVAYLVVGAYAARTVARTVYDIRSRVHGPREPMRTRRLARRETLAVLAVIVLVWPLAALGVAGWWVVRHGAGWAARWLMAPVDDDRARAAEQPADAEQPAPCRARTDAEHAARLDLQAAVDAGARLNRTRAAQAELNRTQAALTRTRAELTRTQARVADLDGW